jgi:hypothetical protein
VLAVREWWFRYTFIKSYIMDAKGKGVKRIHMVPDKGAGNFFAREGTLCFISLVTQCR